MNPPRRILSTMLATMCALALCVPRIRAIELADGGQPRAVIVIPVRATSAERSAAKELHDYVGRITGADLPLTDDGGEATAGLNRISIGATRLLSGTGITARDLEPEGFRIKSDGDSLFILGADAQGLQYGVYDFLERQCGVRWFYPGPDGEEVPRQPTLRVAAMDERQAPWFRQRRFGKLDPDFARKWKIGSSLEIVGTHAWGQMVSPSIYGPTHPEYFAEVNGTRQRDWSKFDGSHSYQLCVSNPEVVRLAIAWANRYFDEHPAVDILSISPNDGGGFCECERCRAEDVPGNVLVDNHGASRPVITDRMYTFANAVAAGVARAHPDKKVLMLAYSSYREPPQRVKVHPNLVVQFCDNADFHWDPVQNATRVHALEQWAALSPSVGIYEYYAWSGFDPPRGLVPVIAESIKRFQRLNVRLFRTQAQNDFGRSGLNYYVAAKLLWNPTLDPDAIVDDYCTKAFGAGGAFMRRYFQLLDERWKTAVQQIGGRMEYMTITPMHASFYLVAYDAEARARLWALLDQAEAAARTPAQKARVRFFAGTLRYTELTVTGIEKITELQRQGLVALPQGTGISQSPTQILRYTDPATLSSERRAKARALLAGTLQRWNDRERCIDQLEGHFALDVRVLRAGEKYYHFNPLAKLQEMAVAYEIRTSH